MKKASNRIEKMIAHAAYKTAEKRANSGCAFFFYQSKLPETVKKLRKF